jgi:hypothetical protein
MEKPFNQRPIGQPFNKFKPPTDTKYKYFNRVNLPERKIDENLVSKLFLLVDEGNISKIKDFLLQNAFLLNIKNDITNESVLHTVIKSENISIEDKTYLVKFFLFKGVSAVSFDKFNITPIHLAVKNQLKDVVDLLIKYGADPNTLDSNNMNTLHYAVIGKNIKCPVKLEEKKFIIPKKGKTKTKEQFILQDLFNNINNLYFMDVASQDILLNVYNNIDNYNSIYDDIIKKKEKELENTVGTILRKEDTSIEKKSELIKDELDKISDELKGSFMKELDSNVIDFSKEFNFDNNTKTITFNNPLLDIHKIFAVSFDNIPKSLKEIDTTINELINSVDNTTKNVSNIKNELVNIRWLNATLIINYEWNGNQTMIFDINGNSILYNNIYNLPVNTSISIVEDKLDQIYELANDKQNLEDYNLIYPDTNTIDLTLNYNDFDLDFTNKFSDSASRYKEITAEEEKNYNDENKINPIKKTILSYYNGQYKYIFPYTFKSTSTDTYTLSNEVKRTFLKRVYALSKLLNEQINIIKTNFGLIFKYIDNSDSWNIMIHIVPSIIISIFNSMRILKAINNELDIINPKLKEIEKLFIDIQNTNKTLKINHFWIYEKAIDTVKICEKETEQIKKNTNSQYKLLLTIIEKYNSFIDKLQDLQGIIHLMPYHDANFLTNKYTRHFRYFSDKFDNFKLNFEEYKQLDSIKNTRPFFEKYLNNLFNNTKNTFYDQLDQGVQAQKTLITPMINVYNFKYPDNNITSNNDQAPTINYKNFMTFKKYTTGLTAGIYHNPLYQFKDGNILAIEEPTVDNDLIPKYKANYKIIKNIIGNHYILQKYSLINNISNIFTSKDPNYDNFRNNIKTINGGELYKNIQKNIQEYKQEYMKKMKITNKDFQNTHYKLLVDVLSETFDNYIEFLIKQKSKQIAYGLFKSYKLKNYSVDDITIDSIEHYPIVKNDKQFKNLGISTKLTIDEIENIEASDYYDYIDNDLIKETKSIEYYKTDDNTCFQVNEDIIKILIDNKANLSQKDNSGRIPIMYALEFKNLQLIDILSKDNGIEFYKNNQDVSNYFNTLIKSTINELVNGGSYIVFYEKYEKKIIKKLESKTEINTNILASIEYTIPMYLSLLNSLLFNVLLNYKYKYTQDDLDKLLHILFSPIDKNLYYGPIIHKIDSEIDLKDQSKIISKKELDNEIKKIEDKINFDENSKKESENEITHVATKSNLFETIRNEQLNLIITDLTKSIADNKTKENLLKKLNITEDLKKLDKNKIKITQRSIKNVSNMYNNIFKNILNDNKDNKKTKGYTSESFDVKRYKALWKDYKTESHSKYISNIHLVSMNFIDNNLTKDELNTNLNNFTKLFEVFNKVAKDYSEGPLEFNMTNYHLEEIIKLIIHTLTHTVINYLYFTITKMIIKQLEETYNDKIYSTKKEYQEYIIKLLQQILSNRVNTKVKNSELITYLFEDMPEKLVKCTLNIYDTDADPDYKKPIDAIFNEIIRIIKSNSLNIINTGDDSELIKNLTTYVIPYYKEYSTIIINELFDLTNKFFKHLGGMHELLQIYKKLN